MKTKQKIQEGLDGFKRSEKVNGLINRATNHLFDAFREMEMAISVCDNPNVRHQLEDIKERLGRDHEVAGYIDNDHPTVISDLQELMGDIKID